MKNVYERRWKKTSFKQLCINRGCCLFLHLTCWYAKSTNFCNLFISSTLHVLTWQLNPQSFPVVSLTFLLLLASILLPTESYFLFSIIPPCHLIIPSSFLASLSFHSHHFQTALFCCCSFLLTCSGSPLSFLLPLQSLFPSLVMSTAKRPLPQWLLSSNFSHICLVGFVQPDQKVFHTTLFRSLYAKQCRTWQIFFFLHTKHSIFLLGNCTFQTFLWFFKFVSLLNTILHMLNKKSFFLCFSSVW